MVTPYHQYLGAKMHNVTVCIFGSLLIIYFAGFAFIQRVHFPLKPLTINIKGLKCPNPRSNKPLNHEPKVFQNTFVNFKRCHSVYFGVITNSIFCWFCFRTKRTFPLLQSLLKKEFFPLENLRMFFFTYKSRKSRCNLRRETIALGFVQF